MPLTVLTVVIAAVLTARPTPAVGAAPPATPKPSYQSSTLPFHRPPSPPPPLSPGHYLPPVPPTSRPPSQQKSHSSPPPPPPTSRRSSSYGRRKPSRVSRRRMNLGKKIGLLFAGIATLLQVAVAGFLGFKRWQISNMKEVLSEPPA